MLRDYNNDLSQIKPKEPKINGSEDWYNSAVLALLTEIDGEYHFVFEERSNQISQPGQICFPGGLHEPEKDNSFQATALRETREEIGLNEAEIEIITPLDIVVLQGLLIVEPFLAVTEIADINNLVIDQQEVAQVFTVPLDYFMEHEPEEYKVLIKVFPYEVNESGKKEIIFPADRLGLADKYKKPWGERYNSLLVYEIDDYTIWGITARIIYDAVKRIREV